jgi:hypothetical protein
MEEQCKRKVIKWKTRIPSQLGFTLQQQLANKGYEGQIQTTLASHFHL